MMAAASRSNNSVPLAGWLSRPNGLDVDDGTVTKQSSATTDLVVGEVSTDQDQDTHPAYLWPKRALHPPQSGVVRHILST